MTDKKISELPEITTPATADILPIVDIDANLTKKITTANLTTYINSNFDTEPCLLDKENSDEKNLVL